MPGIVLSPVGSVSVLQKFSLVLKTEKWKNNASFTNRKTITKRILSVLFLCPTQIFYMGKGVIYLIGQILPFIEQATHTWNYLL